MTESSRRRLSLKTGDDISIDIENASLDDVHKHAEIMNANIAELIMGLDDAGEIHADLRRGKAVDGGMP